MELLELHREGLYNFLPLVNIARVIDSRKVRWWVGSTCEEFILLRHVVVY
jgi:hypothetical protein